MKIKMIASDFDGTLFYHGFVTKEKPGGAVSPRNISAINEFKRQGGIFVLSTGRMFEAVLPYAKDMKLSGELIAYQGAGIYDLATLKTVHTALIGPELASETLDMMEEHSVCHVYFDGHYYVTKPNKYTDFYAEYTGYQPTYVGMPLSEFVVKENMSIFKIYSSVHGREKKVLAERLRENFKGRLLVTGSQSTNVEIVSTAASKSNGVKWVAEKYGVKREEVMAFGDALNDLDMIEYAGVGIAMKGSDPKLLKAADVVAEACEDDGVAKIIEEYCLK